MSLPLLSLLSSSNIFMTSNLISRGSKITAAFPDIHVTTKHTYEIVYKYIFTCSNALCNRDFGRQSKLDLSRVCCGGCKSPLIQTKPAINREKGEMAGRRTNLFGMFVGEFFAEVRRENPGVTHKEVMGILSRMYKERKEKSGKEDYTVGQEEIDLGK